MHFGMDGTLHLNAIGRWEIVNELGVREEITSGDVIHVASTNGKPTEDLFEALRQAWACIEHLSQYAPPDMRDDALGTLKDIESELFNRWVRTRIEHGPQGYYAVEGVSLYEGQPARRS